MVKYPLAILASGLLVLTPLAVLGARARSNYSQLGDLDPDCPSVVGAGLVRPYFAIGELGPTEVLLENSGLDFRSPRGRAAIEEITSPLASMESVAEIRSPDPAPG